MGWEVAYGRETTNAKRFGWRSDLNNFVWRMDTIIITTSFSVSVSLSTTA
jgi:hypothetical protein